MGTWVAIEARAADGPDEPAAIDAAYSAISAIEQAMHPHRPGSDLARINAAPLHTPIRIRPDTWHLLQFARRIYDLTGGVFDPCVPNRPGRFQDVELGPDLMLVCRAPVEIDLGGIAKGFAIDRAIEKLIELGCNAGLVNAGGDLRVFGDTEEIILLRRTGHTRVAATEPPTGPGICVSDTPGMTYLPLSLRNAALAVSDFDITQRPIEHQGYYNRADADPTCPEDPWASPYAAVIAQNATTADALTKCMLLCSPEGAALALRELDATSAWD